MTTDITTHLVFIVAAPEDNTGVVTKATDNMSHFFFHIGKEVLSERRRQTIK